MEADRFDTLTARLAAPFSRRTSVGLLSVLGIGGLAVADQAHAKKKKKKPFCLDGQTITTSSKKKRKKLLKQGATAGACPTCTPQCQGKTCGVDGCGGSCGTCGAVPCVNGLCSCVGQPNATDCGNDRQCSGGACALRPTCDAAGSGCTTGANCCSNACEFDNQCSRSNGGQPCVTDAGCLSGSCVGFVCQA